MDTPLKTVKEATNWDSIYDMYKKNFFVKNLFVKEACSVAEWLAPRT